MADKSVDEPLKKKDGEEEEEQAEEELEYPMQENLSDYYYPELFYAFIEKRWGAISSITGVIYAIHLFFAIYGVDQFTDFRRLRKCGDKSPEDSSAVY